MLAHNAVADISYVFAKQEERERAEEAAGLRGASADERVATVREGVRVHRGNSYYDKDSSEEEGRFWRPKMKDAVLAKLMTVEPGKEARVGAGRRIVDGVEAGQGVETKIARLISMGYDPFTKERLVPSACAYHEKKAQYPEKMTENDEKRRPRAGYDSTYSIDKPASTLWAEAITRGDHKQAKAIEAALLAAVNDAEQFAYDNGLVRTRRASMEGGQRDEYYEAVADFTSVNFLHKTNRNGDAQLHVHNLKLNACVRADGTTGTLDTDEFYYQKPVIDAVFKASFYDRLRQIEGLEDIDIVRGDKDVRIRGISQELVETLSSRRLEVVEELEKRGLTTADRRAAEMAAKATRNEKTDLPPLSALVDRWRDTILQHTDGEGLIAKLEKREKTDEDRDTRIPQVAMEAVERFGHTQTIVTERDVLTETYRAAQGEFGLADIPEIVHFVKSRFLIQGEYDQDGRQLWGITDLVEKERSFLTLCSNTPKVPPLVTEERIKTIIEKYKPNPALKIRGLNEEQKSGLYYMLRSTSPIAILEGSAGAGKSFEAGRMKEAVAPTNALAPTAKQVKAYLGPQGITVHGISPSWKATDVLRQDMNLQDEHAKACAKFIADYKAGKLKIDSNTVVAIDEAGMVGIDDMNFISNVVIENGGRLWLLGDTQQLSPVAAGSPMSMAQKILGSHRLNEIMRQNDPDNPERSARYREASSLFVKQGRENIEQAIGIYAAEGRMIWKDDLEQTYHAAADKFLELYNPDRPKDALIITKRNIDVHAINAEVRKSMIERGLLGKDEVTFEAIQRNAKDKESGVQLCLRAGERVIFGERLEKSLTGLPLPINNSDMATIKAVHKDPKTGEPILHLVFDKADKMVVVAHAKQLVGFRAEGEKHIPKMQLAYTVSIYASQGSSIPYIVNANCSGGSYRDFYVSYTRHTYDLFNIVNVGRIEDNKATKAGIVIRDENGKMSIPDKDDARQEVSPEKFQYTQADYLKYISYEASIVDEKKNFTDLDMYTKPGALKAFLADKDWKLTHLEKMKDKVLGQIDIQENRIINNKLRREGKIGASLAADDFKLSPMEGTENPYRDLKAPSIEPDMEALKSTGGADMDPELKQRFLNSGVRLGRFPPPVKAVEAARQVAADIAVEQKDVGTSKLAAPAPEQKVELERRVSQRVSQAEIEYFKRHDPVPLMKKLETSLMEDPKKKSTSRVTYLCVGRGSGEEFSASGHQAVKLNNEGVYIWREWGTKAKAMTVDAWMVHQGHAKDFPAAWHRLREEFGTQHLQDRVTAVKQEREKPKSTYEAHRETFERQLADTGFPGSGKAEERLQAAIDRLPEKEAAFKANPDDKLAEPTNLDRVKARDAAKMLEEIAKGEAPTANKFEQKRAADVRKLVEDGKSVHEWRFKYAMQPPWQSDAYPKERGIERATILRFEHDIKRDVIKDQKTGEWKAGLAFAHRDVIKFGTITGIESKRPVALASNGEPMATTKFTDGEGKGLGMIGNKMRGDKGPTTIGVLESGIDATSWWQENRLPADFKTKTDEQKLAIAKAVPDDTLMLSVAGTASQHALQGIELIARNNPQAKWIIGPDNDFAGRVICDNIRAAILKGNPKAQIEIQPPENILHKDWNDQVRDSIRSPEDLQKEADRMKISTTTIAQHVDRYQASHPDRDLSAYRSLGSKEAEAAETQAAIDVLMKSSDKEIREHLAKHDVEVLGPVRRESARDTQAEKAAAEAAKRRQEEEDRQKQRPAAQRM